MDDADDVVHGVVIDGQTGIAGFCERLRKLFQRNIVLHGHHVYTGRQDLFHLHVIELDGAADELAFPVVSSPSFSASLTMVMSSPSVMASLSLLWTKRPSSFFHWLNSQVSG